MKRLTFVVSLLVGQFTFALCALGGSASPSGFTDHGFSQTKGIQFNGSASNVTTPDGPVLQLTSVNANQAGRAYNYALVSSLT